MEEEGEDTGVESVSDDNSGAVVNGDVALEHLQKVNQADNKNNNTNTLPSVRSSVSLLLQQ